MKNLSVSPIPVVTSTFQKKKRAGKKIWIDTSEKLHRYEKLLNIRELQIETSSYHQTPVRIAEIQNTDTLKGWQEYRATGFLTHCWK